MKKLVLLCFLMFGMMGQSCDGSADQHAPLFSSAGSEANNAAPMPEPSSALIFATGLVIAAAYLRFRK